MNLKKILPILLVLPLVAGCNKSSKKNSSGSGSSSSTSESSPSSQQGTTSEHGSSSSSGLSSSSSSSTSTSTGPGPGVTDQQYLDEFNLLKSSITTNHNYTINVHSYLDGYESEEGGEWYDQVLMIDDAVFAFNGDLTSLGHKKGYIKQGNQGYVNFDYYSNLGDNIVTDGFYSTNSSVGISKLFDAIAENLFIVSYEQNKNVFSTSSIDVKAVVSNLSGYDSTLMLSPEKVYISVNYSAHTLTVTGDFAYWYFDEGEHYVTLKINLDIVSIGSTHNTVFESYVASPTDTYPNRNSWNTDDLALFSSLYPGEAPDFPSGAASYSVTVGEYTDDYEHEPTSHFHKVVYNNYDSGNLTSSYVSSYIENQLFTEGTAVRPNSRLFERTRVDVENMTKTYHKIEIGFIEADLRFPQGIFWILFSGYTEPSQINTVQSFNQYLSLKGYTQYVPQLNIDGSIAISHFGDDTESKNTSAGEHAYEFVTSADLMRIHITNYADAVAAVNSYTSLFASYGFVNPQHLPFPYYQISYGNSEDFKSPSTITISDVEAIGESSYSGYIQIRYLVYAEKDEEDIPYLTSIEIGGTPTTEFSVGDTFTYGGTVRAWYSNGDCSGDISSSCTFSGYDMSQSGNQHITIQYEEGGRIAYAYYDIHVKSNRTYTGYLGIYGGIDFSINLCDDLTGTYYYSRRDNTGSGTAHFTYVIEGSTITFRLSEEISLSTFNAMNLFPGTAEGTTRNCSYDSVNDTMTITVSNSYGTNERTVDLTRAS